MTLKRWIAQRLKAPVDSAELCKTSVDAASNNYAYSDGRWVSTQHLNPVHLKPTSPHFWWLQQHVRSPLLA
jgi:hypothetical protein